MNAAKMAALIWKWQMSAGVLAGIMDAGRRAPRVESIIAVSLRLAGLPVL